MKLKWVILGVFIGILIGGGSVYLYFSTLSPVKTISEQVHVVDYSSFNDPLTIDELLDDMNQASNAPIVDLAGRLGGTQIVNYREFLELVSIGSHCGYDNASSQIFGAMVTVDGAQYRYMKSYIEDDRSPTPGILSIDEASCSSTLITALIRNVGGSDITIDKIYIDSSLIIDDSGILIAKGITQQVEIPNNGTKGTTYEVQIVGTDNTQLVFSVKHD